MKTVQQGTTNSMAMRDSNRELASLLRRMWVIRAFEEKVSALYAAPWYRAGSCGGGRV